MSALQMSLFVHFPLTQHNLFSRLAKEVSFRDMQLQSDYSRRLHRLEEVNCLISLLRNIMELLLRLELLSKDNAQIHHDNVNLVQLDDRSFGRYRAEIQIF